MIVYQRRRRRSGWSGLGRTTFQRVVGLVPRLQGQSEDETIGPSIHAACLALFVRVSCNHSRSFAQRSLTGLYRHPRVAKYTMRIGSTAASGMTHSAACSSFPSESTRTPPYTCMSDLLFAVA